MKQVLVLGVVALAAVAATLFGPATNSFRFWCRVGRP
jgi:hypothetical protein